MTIENLIKNEELEIDIIKIFRPSGIEDFGKIIHEFLKSDVETNFIFSFDLPNGKTGIVQLFSYCYQKEKKLIVEIYDIENEYVLQKETTNEVINLINKELKRV